MTSASDSRNVKGAPDGRNVKGAPDSRDTTTRAPARRVIPTARHDDLSPSWWAKAHHPRLLRRQRRKILDATPAAATTIPPRKGSSRRAAGIALFLGRNIDAYLPELAVIAAAAALSFLCRTAPAELPGWAPWDFSWTEFLGLGFALVWFLRGSRNGGALPLPRRIAFFAGLALFYVMLLTHFDYLAQHMFFFNRIQHAVLHHLGPFLIALSWPAEPFARGVPAFLRRGLAAAPARTALRAVRQPVVAILLFEGLLVLWLVPAVSFVAMLNRPLYLVMNTSMLIDGLLFWFLVLDPRSQPPAPLSFFTRLALGFLVIFPQIMLGTGIGLVQHDLYPSFALCGRIFPAITPLADQQIGSLIIWIPTGMMSSICTLTVMRRMYAHDDTLHQLPA